MSAPEGTSPGELAAFEARLRRSGIRRRHGSGDPALTALLDQIDDRRRRRRSATTPEPGREHARPVPADGPDRALASGAPGTILSIEPVGTYIRIFRVVPPSGFRYRAGQYVKVGTGAGKRRSFSLASAPHEGHLELCIALNPGGTLTPALFALAPGARLDIDPRPRGGFGLVTPARRHLMVATGTGIGPLRSMVRAALHRGSGDEILILHGASHPDGLPYRDELAALAAAQDRVTYRPTVSRPEASPQAWPGHTGRVDALAIDVARSFGPADTHVYICGNPGMVASLTETMGRAGFAVSREAFD